MESLTLIFGFLISLIVSAIIIYLATRLFGETEGFGTAIMAALAGALIFSIASYFIATGWIAALIGGIAWLIALGNHCNMGMLKSMFIAIMVSAFATLVNLVLPTIVGPL